MMMMMMTIRIFNDDNKHNNNTDADCYHDNNNWNDDHCNSPDLLLFILLLLIKFLAQFLDRFALTRFQLSKLRICLILHLQSHLPTKSFNHEIILSIKKYLLFNNINKLLLIRVLAILELEDSLISEGTYLPWI